MKTLVRFFWNRNYPVRSFMRIFVALSILVYLWGRIVDPGPIWAQSMIQYLISTCNLEFIQSIGLLGLKSPTLWRGSGFALQMQLLITWPVMWVFALTADWMCRNGNKCVEASLAKVPIPRNLSIHDWLISVTMVVFLLWWAYFPFQGSNVARFYKATSVFNAILFDSPTTAAFWIAAGCWLIYMSAALFCIINTEYHLTFNKRQQPIYQHRRRLKQRQGFARRLQQWHRRSFGKLRTGSWRTRTFRRLKHHLNQFHPNRSIWLGARRQRNSRKLHLYSKGPIQRNISRQFQRQQICPKRHRNHCHRRRQAKNITHPQAKSSART